MASDAYPRTGRGAQVAVLANVGVITDAQLHPAVRILAQSKHDTVREAHLVAKPNCLRDGAVENDPAINKAGRKRGAQASELFGIRA